MKNRDTAISYVPFGIVLITPLAALILLSSYQLPGPLMFGILFMIFLEMISPLFPPASTTGSLLSSRSFKVLFSGLLVIHLWFITAGGRSLFGTDIFGYLPDALAKSFLSGRADLSAHDLQNEAWFANGKHFTHFGTFPAFLRVIPDALAPQFFGRWSRLSCFIAGSLTLWAIAMLFQAALHRIDVKDRLKTPLLCGLMIGSALGTPLFLLMITACLYHEVFIWGLCGSMWVLAVFFDDHLQSRRPFLALFLITSFSAIALLSRMTFGAPCLVIAALSALRCFPPQLSDKRPLIKWVLALAPIVAALGFFALYNHARFGTIWTVYPLNALVVYQHTAPEWLPSVLDWKRVPTALRSYLGFSSQCLMPSFPFFRTVPSFDFDVANNYKEMNFPLTIGSPWLIVPAIGGLRELLKFDPQRRGLNWRTLLKNEAVLHCLVFYALLAECLVILAAKCGTWRYQTEFLPLLFFLVAFFFQSSGWRRASDRKKVMLACTLFFLIGISVAATAGATLELASRYYYVQDDFRLELHGIFNAINSRLQ